MSILCLWSDRMFKRHTVNLLWECSNGEVSESEEIFLSLSYSKCTFGLARTCCFSISPVISLCKEVARLNATYICPKLKYFCPYKSKLTTTSFNVNRFTLCTVQAHANARGNCNLCISGEDCLSGTSQLNSSQYRSNRHCTVFSSISVCAFSYSPSTSFRVIKLYINYRGFICVLVNSCLCYIVPICPLISLSFISTFTVSITLAFSFTRMLVSSPQVSDLPLDNTLSMSCFVTFRGYWSTAFNVYKGADICSICALSCWSTGAFQQRHVMHVMDNLDLLDC